MTRQAAKADVCRCTGHSKRAVIVMGTVDALAIGLPSFLAPAGPQKLAPDPTSGDRARYCGERRDRQRTEPFTTSTPLPQTNFAQGLHLPDAWQPHGQGLALGPVRCYI